MSPRPCRALSLPHEARLQRPSEFAAVRQKGQRLIRGCLIANWLALAPGSRSRLGVVTSRKVGGAVIRSRARRLLREAFRLHQHTFRTAVALVLVARPSIRGKGRAEVEHDLLAALRSAGLLAAAPSSTRAPSA